MDGDEFAGLVEPLRRELHAHCYRMLGSTHDADDALQNTLVQAWRGLGGFEGRSTLRRWMYAVATRCCLDLIAARCRRALPIDLGPSSNEPVVDDMTRMDVAWLGPYPDDGLESTYEQREAVELAFVAAVQHLPGNQRAALLLFEVLGFSAAEIAETMQTSTASVNSALQRARAVLAARAPSRSQQQALRTLGDVRLRELVTGFASALERGDADALIALLSADVTWSMPPLPNWYRGINAVSGFVRAVPLGSCGQWRARELTANAQPAIALYLRTDPDDEYRAWSLNVLSMHDDAIGEVTSFIGSENFTRFGLPVTV
ncbi:MAG: Pyridoxamine 5-phosphate oxidase-like FMN-binding protein [Pseudonocardiales bacterium]|nr:Pyridoxamine 5-phosphate oxidase-like FMN-binding protein [Pseudonocardiales bacterium]